MSRYILTLTLLLVEAYKESRQKILVAHKKYNLKTAILQYFIDTAANMLHYLGDINLDPLNSRRHTTYVGEQQCFGQSNLVRLKLDNLTSTEGIIHGRADIILTLSLEAYKAVSYTHLTLPTTPYV